MRNTSLYDKKCSLFDQTVRHVGTLSPRPYRFTNLTRQSGIDTFQRFCRCEYLSRRDFFIQHAHI